MIPPTEDTEELKAVLREHGGKHSLCGAVANNMPEVVAEFIKEGTDVNAEFKAPPNLVGFTLLSASVLLKKQEVTYRLIELGASVNKPCLDPSVSQFRGFTPLHFAAAVQASAEVVGRLIEAGASVDLRATDGKTPLQLAQDSGQTEIENLLKAHGAE